MQKDRFHRGEIEIQELTGEREHAESNGQIISDQIISGALHFAERQPFIVLGTMNSKGNHEASILFGKPGFVCALSQKEMRIDLSQVQGVLQDSFFLNLQQFPYVGTLLIELDTRRRLKVNGKVSSISAEQIVMEVRESFPLCPKYIQRRAVSWAEEEEYSKQNSTLSAMGVQLGQAQLDLIRSCDTMFLVSSHPAECLDVSHRGGAAGFVNFVEPNLLMVPDYSGNGMFNSLGNLRQNSQAALLMLDFSRRQYLHISGTVELKLGEPDPVNQSGGTGRFWFLEPTHWISCAIPNLQSQFIDHSPFNPLKNTSSNQNLMS